MNRVEETSHAETARSIVGADAYGRLSLAEKAELELLVKATSEGDAPSQQALCQKVYGDKLTPAGLSRRLKSRFKLQFAHGRLEPVQRRER